MTVRKRILAEGRVRRPPSQGWSWVDRRFLRDHAPSVSREAILLYFFLAAVSDKHGLSYYGNTAISSRLRLEEVVIQGARDELEARDLIAYEPPLYQVLSVRSGESRQHRIGATALGELLAEIDKDNGPRRLRVERRRP